MKGKKLTFSAGLVILLGVWILGGFSESQAQSPQTLDLSNTLVQDYIRSAGIIATKPLPFLGSIVGSQDERGHLSEGDLVYIKLEPGKQVKAGDRYYMVRWGREVTHPISRKTVGNIARVPGTVVILDGKGQTVPARVDRSYFQIRYDDLIISAAATPLPVVNIRSQEKIQATVLASSEEEENITQGVAVYIDRGSQDGVILGDPFTIYQMPYYSPKHQETGEKLPWLKVGEAVAVFVSAETSTLLVTKSSQAIYVGDLIVSGRNK